ncbi:hypothetical protein H0X06_04905 [Candidatus Dependentiae bacterium]|nr:hypothetical protein [Candidatus Dependentiae bacterium]
MRRILYTLISVSVLLAGSLHAKTCTTKKDDCSTDVFKNLRTILHPRSQGANTARELIGWQWELNKPEQCENYGAGYLTFEYQRTFKSKQLAQGLFGTPVVSFAGSAVTDRTPRELLADNFGFAPDFRGHITFKPRIENYIVDLGFYLGLEGLTQTQGLYLRLHAPFVHTRWNLDTNCGNCVSIKTSDFTSTGALKKFDPCYMGEDSVNTAETIKQALSGRFLFGDMQTPWCSGKFNFTRATRNGLADIDVILGYNIINDDCYHLGLYGQAVLPTGKKQKSVFVFDPTIGNGKFFELGAGLSAHTVLWSGEDSNVALFLEGNVTHMFRTRQCRLFDFNDNGPFSRYMLLKEFNTNGTSFTYANNLISATCFATREVDVSVAIKADFSLKLAYRWCGLGIDLGYNGYGHSHESIELRCTSCPSDIDKRRFGIKGTENTCCFNFPIAEVPQGQGAPVPTIFPVGAAFPEGSVAPLNCADLEPVSEVEVLANNGVQTNATAFKGGTRPLGTVPSDACDVCINGTAVTRPTPVSQLTPANGFFINNGLQPQLLTVNDLNIRSAEAHSVVTHKLFAHICYTWMDECGWNPQVGLGGEIEFDGNHLRCGPERTGLNQWGVWVKGCISF